MATQVSVVTAATGAVNFYSTYAAARSAAGTGDLIQVWADLTDEQILLKDNVDIWIAPGRIMKMTDTETLIIDNIPVGYSSAVNVNITGNGIFKGENDKYGCVKIVNSNSRVSITCDTLENEAYDDTSLDGSNIYIVNASKFYLFCNKVSNSRQRAIYFENEVADININANIIENGDIEGGDVISLKGLGFLNANEVICKNEGSCLNFKAGTLIANILKLTTINTDVETSGTVELSGGTGSQNLTLYFDEIQNLSSKDGNAVVADQGKINLFGRRVYSVDGMSMDLASNADIIVDEIISDTKGINIHNGSTQKIVIDSNYIEGSSENDGVVRSASGSNYILRNAKVKNTYSSSPSIGIYIAAGTSSTDQTIELENLIIVTGTGNDDFSIFRAGSIFGIAIKNLGLFVKKDKNSLVSFAIGTSTNFKFIVSTDIT